MPAQNALFSTRRCTDAEWSYEDFGLAVPVEGTPVRAWDGTRWFTVSYAPLYPPPDHVHVDIEASAGSPPIDVSATVGLQHAKHITDALLNPRRTHVASLGRVRWYGKPGQLLLRPTNANGGGEVAGHLIFYFASGGVNCAVSLHAWASKVRIGGGSPAQVITAPQAGPALPHVIATLKAIVGSTAASSQRGPGREHRNLARRTADSEAGAPPIAQRPIRVQRLDAPTASWTLAPTTMAAASIASMPDERG